MAPISTTGGRALQLPQCIPLRVTSHPLIPNRSDYSACLVHLSDTTLYDFDKRHASKPIAVSIPDTGNRTDAARGVLFSSSSSSSCSSCSSSYLFTPTEAPINGTTQGWLTVSDFTIVSMRCYGVKSFATSASFPVTYISATQSVQPDFNEEERFGQAEVAPLLKDMQTLVRMLLGLRDWEKLRQRATRAHTQADRGSSWASEDGLRIRAYREMLSDALRQARAQDPRNRVPDGWQQQQPVMQPVQNREIEKERTHTMDCVVHTIEYLAYPRTVWSAVA